jgi:hypothetical protein
MKDIIGYIKEITYGKVQISVPDDAEDEEIRDAILEHDSAGGTRYTSCETEVTGWEDDL